MKNYREIYNFKERIVKKYPEFGSKYKLLWF